MPIEEKGNTIKLPICTIHSQKLFLRSREMDLKACVYVWGTKLLTFASTFQV